MADIQILNAVTGEDIFPKLTPGAQEAIQIAVAGGPFPDDPVEKRAAFDRLFAQLSGKPETIHHTEDLFIPMTTTTVPARLYRPAEGVLPAIVYYHGGGFNKGGLASHDTALRALANTTGSVVVAVDYPLTPEHQYPAQIDASLAALNWVADNAAELQIDLDKIALGGDSVGGNLVAVTALRARDAGTPKVAFQLMFYPVTDVTLSTQSWREMANGPWLTQAGEHEGFSVLYLPPETDAKNPHISPLYARDLSGLPPALILDAEFDPYRDEGQQYAARLREAGVPVTAEIIPGVIHDFILMAGKLPEARQAFEKAADALNKHW